MKNVISLLLVFVLLLGLSGCSKEYSFTERKEAFNRYFLEIDIPFTILVEQLEGIGNNANTQEDKDKYSYLIMANREEIVSQPIPKKLTDVDKEKLNSFISAVDSFSNTLIEYLDGSSSDYKQAFTFLLQSFESYSYLVNLYELDSKALD